jgi:hypothetical protein
MAREPVEPALGSEWSISEPFCKTLPSSCILQNMTANLAGPRSRSYSIDSADPPAQVCEPQQSPSAQYRTIALRMRRIALRMRGSLAQEYPHRVLSTKRARTDGDWSERLKKKKPSHYHSKELSIGKR